MEAALANVPDGPQMLAIFRVGIETGMRLGEILGLSHADISSSATGRLSETKNGSSREVILSAAALAAIRSLPVRRLDGRVFALNVAQFEYRWKKARAAAGIEDLHFHDMRHEALSRMSARKTPLKIMMMQSGHKQANMLLRYINPTVDERRQALGL